MTRTGFMGASVKLTFEKSLIDFSESRHLCLEPRRLHVQGPYFTEICSGSGAGWYFRLIDFCITQL